MPEAIWALQLVLSVHSVQLVWPVQPVFHPAHLVHLVQPVQRALHPVLSVHSVQLVQPVQPVNLVKPVQSDQLASVSFQVEVLVEQLHGQQASEEPAASTRPVCLESTKVSVLEATVVHS